MLKSSIGGINIDCCIYNASGPRTGSIESLQKLGNAYCGAILSKSATFVEQDGDKLPRLVSKISLGPQYAEGSLYSNSLPNHGIEYYIAKGHIDKLKGFQKPYIVSIAGLSIQDNINMLTQIYQQDGVSGVELNMACCNAPGKPIVAYDFDQFESCLDKICAHPMHGIKPLGIKLAPYFDISHFHRVADIIAKFPVHYIVSVNSIPMGLVIDADGECEAIASNNGLGGLAGGFIKHTALANVRMLYQLLKERGRSDIDIVGVGGISTGRDVFEMILCGAKAIQIGTCHWSEGSACFSRIAGELQSIMKRKGYRSIEDFRGKLKPYQKSQKEICPEDSQEENAEPPSKESKSFPAIKLDVFHKFLLGTLVVLLAALLEQSKLKI